MSFIEKLGKMFAKFTAPPEGWELMLTEEQLLQQESQGVDISHIRKVREEHFAKVELEKQKLGDASFAAVDLSMLDPYLSAPRDVTSQFVTDAASFNKNSKDKWKKAFGRCANSLWCNCASKQCPLGAKFNNRWRFCICFFYG